MDDLSELLEPIQEALSDYGDWKYVFEYSDFPASEVKRTIAFSNGYNDGDNWVGVFELKDGCFGYVEAGCDYTGWG